MGITAANAKAIAGYLIDNGIAPQVVKFDDGTWDVFAENAGGTWTTGQMNAAAAQATPAAIARAGRVQFTNV